MAIEGAGTTLRDQLSDALTRSEDGMLPSTDPAPLEPKADGPQQDKIEAGRTAGRERDDQGRLLPGTSKKAPDAPKGDIATTPAAATDAPQRAPLKVRGRDIQWWDKPSTWKPDLSKEWDALPDAIKQNFHIRESDFANGISTYKSQWDQAKPLLDALAPHQQMLEQYGIEPAKQIDRYLRIHQQLALGSPQDKIAVVAQIMRDYKIPAEQLFVQGQDGRLYFNQNLQQPQQPQAQTQGLSPDQVREMVSAELSQHATQSEVKNFSEMKGDDGNPRFPHFWTVKDTMAGLLQTGLANDLGEAYEVAMKMPQHSDIATQIQQQDEAKRQAEDKAISQAKVSRARQANVSVRTQTPNAASLSDKPKGLRSQLESAFDSAATGRV